MPRINVRRFRQAPSHFVAPLALTLVVAGCGEEPAKKSALVAGDGGPSVLAPGTGEPTPTKPPVTAQPDAAPTDAGRPAPDASDAASPNTGLPQKPGAVTEPPPPRGAVVCSRQTVGLDLGRMAAVAPTPQLFAAAWGREQAATVAPGFVLRLDKLDVGPVSATVGSVHALSAVEWAFDTPPLSARNLFVNVDSTNRLKLSIPLTRVSAVVSFGNDIARRGFVVTRFALDGEVPQSCDRMTGSATLVISGASGVQSFGGSTVAELLGAPTIDTDNNNAPDAWLVKIAGPAGLVKVEGGP